MQNVVHVISVKVVSDHSEFCRTHTWDSRAGWHAVNSSLTVGYKLYHNTAKDRNRPASGEPSIQLKLVALTDLASIQKPLSPSWFRALERKYDNCCDMLRLVMRGRKEFRPRQAVYASNCDISEPLVQRQTLTPL